MKFGEILGVILIRIPEIAVVTQKIQFSNFLIFQNSNAHSSELVDSTKKCVRYQKIALGLKFILGFEFLKKMSTNSWLMAIFHVFTFWPKNHSVYTLNSTLNSLKWSVEPNGVFRVRYFLVKPTLPILGIPGIDILQNQWRRPLVAKLSKQKRLRLKSSVEQW